MSTDILDGAADRFFGLPYLFPYQRLVVSNLLEAAEAVKAAETKTAAADTGEAADTDRAALGRQLVILPTGAGKSLCFQLPALLMDRPTLVIYPILSLMADQERRLAERGFSPVLLRGGQSAGEREAVWAKLR
ncbi:MAG: ATP-dependent DNA helicase RecQ, partial [Treponema sp.]|nr:ATP-dependent DNA helicase RecQ [Treponema sp.]